MSQNREIQNPKPDIQTQDPYDPTPDLIRLRRRLDGPDRDSPLSREIGQLRDLIRLTRHKINKREIDFQAGTYLIARSATALAQLYLAEHRISPPADNSVQDSFRRILDSILIDEGLGPTDP